MRPRRPESEPADDLFRARLSNQLDPKHPLVRLAGLIEWASFESEFGALYHEVLEASRQADPADGRAYLPATLLQSVG